MSKRDVDLSSYIMRTTGNTLDLDQATSSGFSQDIVDEALNKAITESREELQLKKIVAIYTMCVLVFELIIIAVLIFLHGFKIVTFSDDLLKVYIGSVILQIITTFYVMVKFLFDPNRPSTMQIVQNMISNKDGYEL